MHHGLAGFSFRRLVAAVALGAVIGIGAFAVTGYWSQGVFTGLCQPTSKAGFDPWTGLPHGSTIHCPPESANSIGGTVVTRPQTTFAEPTPPEIATRWAIPVPVGFIAGGGIVLLLRAAQLAATRRRQRSVG